MTDVAELTPGVYDRLVDDWLGARLDGLDGRRLRADIARWS